MQSSFPQKAPRAANRRIRMLLAVLCAISLFACSTGSERQKNAQCQKEAEQEIDNVAPAFLPLGNSEKKLIGNGNKIISAVEAYRSENGGLPESLDALVPRYIAEIPATGMKRTYLLSFKADSAVFQYWHDDADFSLSVRYDMFDEWYYSSRTGLWEWANH